MYRLVRILSHRHLMCTGVHPQPVMMGLRHTRAVRAAHTRKAVSPSPPRPTLQTKWNHGIVPRSALSSITVHIRKLQRVLDCSSFSAPHSPPLFSSSGKHALCSPPGSGACLKTHNGHTTDLSDSCCLPVVFLSYPTRHSHVIKSTRYLHTPVVHS